MSLSEIKNKLYEKEADENLGKHDLSEFDAISSPVVPPKVENVYDLDARSLPENAAAHEVWEPKKKGWSDKQKKILKIGAAALGALLLVIGGVFGFYKYQQSSFDESRVSLQIGGLSEIRSGKLIAYEISYKNVNRASLKNATLRLTYPDNFKPEENPNFKEDGPTTGSYFLGNIAGNSEGKVMLNARTYNVDANLIYMKADLGYTPSTFNSQFVAKTQLGITITSSPVSLTVLTPEKTATGDAVEYLVSYKNIGQEDLDTVRIKMDYPAGFAFARANPVASEAENVWYIGHLSAGQEGRITVDGKLEGTQDETKTVTAYVGTIANNKFLSFATESASSKIVPSPILIEQIVNGQAAANAKAGDTLNYQIRFKNNGQITLKDLIVTEKLDSVILDFASLTLEKGGAFDQAKQTITWKASDHSELALLEPGQGGEIKFSIKIKGTIPVGSLNDKNFVISAVTKIDSPNIESPLQQNKIIAGNETDVKLTSKVILESSGFYADRVISNDGPLPPIVGQGTTYTLHWKVTNVSNDVMDAVITAELPSNVTMTGNISPSGANLVYNDRTNSLTWTIGSISAGAGVITPAKEVAFQVKLTPLPSQVDSTADLIKEAKLTAKDIFTTEDLVAVAPGKTTLLNEDPTTGAGARVRAAN